MLVKDQSEITDTENVIQPGAKQLAFDPRRWDMVARSSMPSSKVALLS